MGVSTLSASAETPQFSQYNLQLYPDAVRGLSDSSHQSAKLGSGSPRYLQLSTGRGRTGEPSAFLGEPEEG